MNDINSLYKLWCEKAVNDKDLIPELKSVEGNQDEILDRFYKNLEFGTAFSIWLVCLEVPFQQVWRNFSDFTLVGVVLSFCANLTD